ncbi:MAG: ribulose-phosphate 3-epimerase [Mycoplasmoidaceae bacterium]
MKIIEASLLAYSRDQEILKNELSLLKQQGITSIHYDVMDGFFVKNRAFEGEFIDLIKSFGFDITVHLMVINVNEYVEKFINYPIKSLTFHIEAINENDSLKILKKIRNKNILAGIALKPETIFSKYIEIFKKVDLVTLMSVEPGQGGQSFISESVRKARDLRNILPENTIIQIDGGINNLNMHLVKKDVNWFVMGNCSKRNISKLNQWQRELNEYNKRD